MVTSPCRVALTAALPVALLVATGCGGAGSGADSASPAPQAAFATEFSSELLQPMGALPECEGAPEPGDVDAVEGLVMPDGAVVVSASETGELVQVMGYVPLTPVQLLDHYHRRDDLSILMSEHEQFESELVYEQQGVRAYVKAQVACATGSNFVSVLASGEAVSAVPTPTGPPGGPPQP